MILHSVVLVTLGTTIGEHSVAMLHSLHSFHHSVLVEVLASVSARVKHSALADIHG